MFKIFYLHKKDDKKFQNSKMGIDVFNLSCREFFSGHFKTYYPQIVYHDMRTDCVGGAPISQWASRAPLAEISPHGWGIHSFNSSKGDTEIRTLDLDSKF